MTSRRSDRGTAAVEAALVLTVLVALVALLAPLALLMRDKVVLGRAVGQAARYAGNVVSGTSPTDSQVRTEALDTYTAAGGAGMPGTPSVSRAATAPGRCVTGNAVTVTMSVVVGYGALGDLVAFLSPSASPTVTMTSTATVCDEAP